MVRIAALMLVFLLLLAPVAAQANGPCPDDPELSADCLAEGPPFFVVVNRDFEDLDRAGTGCQPIILNHPDLEDCCAEDGDAYEAVVDDLVEVVCPLLADKVDWDEQTEPVDVFAMCCDCATDAEGVWKYRTLALYEDGSCELSDEECNDGLPPGTGIDLPAPLIVAGLALLGAVLVGGGALLRRRAPRSV